MRRCKHIFSFLLIVVLAFFVLFTFGCDGARKNTEKYLKELESAFPIVDKVSDGLAIRMEMGVTVDDRTETSVLEMRSAVPLEADSVVGNESAVFMIETSNNSFTQQIWYYNDFEFTYRLENFDDRFYIYNIENFGRRDLPNTAPYDDYLDELISITGYFEPNENCGISINKESKGEYYIYTISFDDIGYVSELFEALEFDITNFDLTSDELSDLFSYDIYVDKATGLVSKFAYTFTTDVKVYDPWFKKYITYEMHTDISLSFTFGDNVVIDVPQEIIDFFNPKMDDYTPKAVNTDIVPMNDANEERTIYTLTGDIDVNYYKTFDDPVYYPNIFSPIFNEKHNFSISADGASVFIYDISSGRSIRSITYNNAVARIDTIDDRLAVAIESRPFSINSGEIYCRYDINVYDLIDFSLIDTVHVFDFVELESVYIDGDTLIYSTYYREPVAGKEFTYDEYYVITFHDISTGERIITEYKYSQNAVAINHKDHILYLKKGSMVDYIDTQTGEKTLTFTDVGNTYLFFSSNGHLRINDKWYNGITGEEIEAKEYKAGEDFTPIAAYSMLGDYDFVYGQTKETTSLANALAVYDNSSGEIVCVIEYIGSYGTPYYGQAVMLDENTYCTTLNYESLAVINIGSR